MKIRTHLELIGLILAVSAVLWWPVFAWWPESVGAQQEPAAKPEPGIKVTPDVTQVIKDLSLQFKEANTAKAYFQAQVEKADARIAELNARLVAEFNHFCAKQRLDPDEYEWNDDLSGLRKKKAQAKPNPLSK